MRERDIPASAIKVWSDPNLSVYIASVAIVAIGNDQKDKQRGRFLLEYTVRWITVLYQRHDIRGFYGLGITPVGQKLLERLGFTEIISLEDGQRKGYVLEDVSKSTALLSKVLSEVAP